MRNTKLIITSLTVLSMLTTACGNDLSNRSRIRRTGDGVASFSSAGNSVSRIRFDGGEFHQTMLRLHAYYAAPEGLQRPNGLSIDGAPDFPGIAIWVFNVYLLSRAGGQSPEDSWLNVVSQIESSEEWRMKHPGRTPMRPRGVPSSQLNFTGNEFTSALDRLDRFYRACEGLKRPNGLSINGEPDFSGISTWIFGVYLNARLDGMSPDASFNLARTHIEHSEEWHAKRSDSSPCIAFGEGPINGGGGGGSAPIDARAAYEGPDEFLPIVAKFLNEGRARGINDFEARSKSPRLEILFDDLYSGGRYTLGQCERSSVRRRISIDAAVWAGMEPARKEVLLFHELGHCVLDRDHRNDLLPNTEQASIMNQVLPHPVIYTGNIQHYLQELFTVGLGSLLSRTSAATASYASAAFGEASASTSSDTRIYRCGH